MAVLLAAPIGAAAQSLAAVARQEEARRKAVREPGKVYTNNDLKPVETTAPATAPDADPPVVEPETRVPAVNLPAGPAGEAPPPKDEAYWRTRISAARSALERSRIFADALQSRINALNTDFVNRDDPAQRAQIGLERQRALAELDRIRLEMAAQEQEIAAIEEEARRAGVPPGWLR